MRKGEGFTRRHLQPFISDQGSLCPVCESETLGPGREGPKGEHLGLSGADEVALVKV